MENKIHNTTVKKGRVNFIDIFILISVIAILVWCVSYYDLLNENQTPPSQSTSEDVSQINGKLTYTVVVENLEFKDSEQLDTVRYSPVKNVLTDNISGKIIGFVFEEKIDSSILQKSEITDEKSEDKVTQGKATFTIEVDAVYIQGDGYFVDGKQILIGNEYPLITKVYLTKNMDSVYKKCVGYCSSLSFVPEEE